MIFSGAVLVMGASGIIAQLLLLRELLITFQSNELSIGIILANWLAIEAAGAWLGRFIERVKRRILLFVAVTAVFSLCLPLAVYLARTWKVVVGVGPGEGMGLHQIFIASLFILLPVSLTHGALFTFACRIRAGNSRHGAVGIGKIYYLETAGTLAGGLIFTYLLITFINSVEASILVSYVNVVFCILLVRYRAGTEIDTPAPSNSTRIPAGIAMGLSILLLTIMALVTFWCFASRIHWSSIRMQWQDQDVVHYQNSIYGNTTVIAREGQYTFFSSGIPVITSPVPDVAFVEEFSHFPLLHHPRPEDIVVIGGGAGGMINEILKHNVKRIDYAELDPLILSLVKKFPTDLTEKELSDPKVQVHHMDGRLFLKETPRRYDVVLIGLSNPQDLQLNRFFTRQFYSLVRDRLKEGGVAAFALPGSLTYMGEELKDLNACVLNTLRDVFSFVRVIPGDGYNLFLASQSAQLDSCDIACVQERFSDSSPNVHFLNPFLINYKLDPRWSRWFSDSMTGATDKLNEDFKPLGVFFSLSYWNAKFAPRLQNVYKRSERVSMTFLAGALLLIAIGLRFLVRGSDEPLRKSIPLVMASTGFTGMILVLALMFTFQALYGVVFYWVGLLVTAFMAGTAIGSLVMTRLIEHIRMYVNFLLAIEAVLATFSVALPLIFLGLESYLQRPGLTVIIRVLFLALSLIAGLLIGMEFPLASRIFMGSSRDIGGTAGLLYGADLLGGWAGGIVGGVILLPVIGLVETCFTLAILKLVSFLLLATERV